MVKQKVHYLFRSAINLSQEKRCPYCNGSKLRKIDGKFFVTALLLCETCKLKHRYPKDDESRLKQFYQKEYSIDTHMMTKLPCDDEIRKLKENNFPAFRSFDTYINALSKSALKIIDYGCSWGYNVFKLLQSGHEAVGYEISIPRAQFGSRKLGVNIFSDVKLLPSQNDIILSSHVIEHLSNIREFITLSKKLLKKDGMFMAFCPNGSEEYRKREPTAWHLNWGDVHPNYLDAEFARFAFRNNPYLILTADWHFNPSDIMNWDKQSQVAGSNLKGKELLIIAKPNVEIRKQRVYSLPQLPERSGTLVRMSMTV
jgi:hypothetical protein